MLLLSLLLLLQVLALPLGGDAYQWTAHGRTSFLRRIGIAGIATISSANSVAAAGARVKGAAELDAEYYLKWLKDEVTGGAPDPTSMARPSPKASRRLDGALASSLLDTTLTQISESGAVDIRVVQKELEDIRAQVGPAFQRKAAFDQLDLTDSYSFDFSAYCLYKAAARLIPDLRKRAYFVQLVGKQTLDILCSSRLLQQQREGKRQLAPGLCPSSASSTSSGAPLLLSKDIDAGVRQLLDEFQQTRMISGYKVDAVDYDDDEYGISNLVVEIADPATIGGFAQCNSEGLRFHPDFIGTAIASYLRTCGLKNVAYDEFLIDDVYRPNPNDFVASGVLIQFST
jgi:hypothetical protein